MVSGLLGKKVNQIQAFLTDGTRIPVTRVYVSGNAVVAVKTMDKHGYNAIQLGFGTKKKAKTPLFLREIRIEDASYLPQVGEVLTALDILKVGDIVDVTGVSKGKGFAGGVKRHHFKGGPRTHGQSDRERAPGSIGMTTTPGRVFKGKRMAGKMGHEKVTVKNLKIVDVDGENVLIKGLIPGVRESLVVIKKVGEDKKFVPLFKEENV